MWGVGENFYTGRFNKFKKPSKIGKDNDWVKIHDLRAAIKNILLNKKDGSTWGAGENNNLVFMNNNTFDQINIDENMIGEQASYLQDGMMVMINIYNEEPVSVNMPDSCVLEVVETEAVIKGQTVSSSFKPAILNNNVKVMVPGHIEVGSKIVVRPSDSSYIEKAKT